MGLISARDVAKYILANFRAKNGPITNLKLQKLLYYVQAWHLAIYDRAVFTEQIEAWVHGPVVPEVFRAYKRFRWSPIDAEETNWELPENLNAHINEIISAYGDFSPWDLERMTHHEAPWREARGSLPPDVGSNAIISHESMKKFYSQQ